MPIVKLQTSDDVIFEIGMEIANQFTTIKIMLENLDLEEGDEEVVALPKINSDILRRLIKWVTHHKDDPPTSDEDDEDKEKTPKALCAWDLDFLNVEQDVLHDILVAANFLEVNNLIEAACRTVANMIRGKTPEEIRVAFGIKNDFSPDEEAKVREENEWYEKK